MFQPKGGCAACARQDALAAPSSRNGAHPSRDEPSRGRPDVARSTKIGAELIRRAGNLRPHLRRYARAVPWQCRDPHAHHPSV